MGQLADYGLREYGEKGKWKAACHHREIWESAGRRVGVEGPLGGKTPVEVG
ncbi:MAG: hypothetical protein ACJAZ8_001803 [Planctomycetota bacterium]|jgi:hypothetical protein